MLRQTIWTVTIQIGLINDMYAESRNDDCKYAELATQEDFDKF